MEYSARDIVNWLLKNACHDDKIPGIFYAGYNRGDFGSPWRIEDLNSAGKYCQSLKKTLDNI